MARPCSICGHPNRAQIELAAANNVSLRVVASRFDIDHSQLSRHRSNHMDQALLRRLRTGGRRTRTDAELQKLRDTEAKSVLDNFVFQRARLYANADRATTIGDDSGERAAMAEASRITERIAKLLGELGQHITVNNHNTLNFVASPQWHAIRIELVRALKPFPVAWPAVIAAIERAESQALLALPLPAATLTALDNGDDGHSDEAELV